MASLSFLQSQNLFQNQALQFSTGFSPGVPMFGSTASLQGLQTSQNPTQITQTLFNLMSVIQQLGAGFSAFAGQGLPSQSFSQFPSFSMPSLPYQNQAFQFYPSPGTPSFGTQNFGTQQPQNGQTVAVGPGFDTNLNWEGLDPSTEAGRAGRTQVSGLDDRKRAALHLWGGQMATAGENDGSIYFNVLQNPDNFKEEEVKLVKELYNQEMALYGGVTGKLLDQHFFGVYRDLTGEDISQRYGNSPIKYSKGPVDMNVKGTNNNGLNGFENAVIRMWGHDPLDNGTMDGSVTEFTLLSENAIDKLDGNMAMNSRAVESLLAADLADGVRDGNALKSAFIDVLDKSYLGGTGASSARTNARAGITNTDVDQIVANWKENPPAGIPAGVDWTNMQNIGKCPILGPSVTQQGGAGGITFG